MWRVLRIPRDVLFRAPEGKRFPERITILTDAREYEADVDVVIGAYRQPDEVNLTVENYLALERKLRVHVFVIEASQHPPVFWTIRGGPQVTRVFILTNPRVTNRRYESWCGSFSVGLTMQLASYLGRSRYLFFSHTDMMGYQENFLSFLVSKLRSDCPLASFGQRHVIPFTGGMVYEKGYFRDLAVDWLPRRENPFVVPRLDAWRSRIEALNWLDTGEQLVFAALSRGHRVYACASRGTKQDFFGEEMGQYGVSSRDVMVLQAGIECGPEKLDRESFARKYPEFAGDENGMWRKSFDDEGNVVFIHRGRGTSRARVNDQRGAFARFVRAFNQRLYEEGSHANSD